eukprot:GHVT01091626.1.p1 GENE.GHVT01091626.1~~GHVT01091626.1.p1  ORF type:complete len:102 (+),score=8.42 GHVT01091626.1:254-559(+)
MVFILTGISRLALGTTVSRSSLAVSTSFGVSFPTTNSGGAVAGSSCFFSGSRSSALEASCEDFHPSRLPSLDPLPRFPPRPPPRPLPRPLPLFQPVSFRWP